MHVGAGAGPSAATAEPPAVTIPSIEEVLPLSKCLQVGVRRRGCCCCRATAGVAAWRCVLLCAAGCRSPASHRQPCTPALHALYSPRLTPLLSPSRCPGPGYQPLRERDRGGVRLLARQAPARGAPPHPAPVVRAAAAAAALLRAVPCDWWSAKPGSRAAAPRTSRRRPQCSPRRAPHAPATSRPAPPPQVRAALGPAQGGAARGHRRG